MKNFILKKIKVRILIIFLIIIFSIISFFKIKIDSKRWINADVTIKLPFEIDILSTGKSDFILIECENKFIVIDCGLYENNTLIKDYLNRDEHNWSFKKWILIRDEKIGKLGLLVIKWPKKGQTIPMRIIKCKILGC